MHKLKPFFSFFGSKWRSIPKYPPPQHNTIIEPFAGSASYSLHYPNRGILLLDVDPVISGVWDYLINVSAKEVESLPIYFDHVNDLAIPQEARWLIGFWLNRATTRPCLVPSKWMRSGNHQTSFWSEEKRSRIANQVEFIRHWRIINASYHSAENMQATWFIDPPYYEQGRCYRFNKIDYGHLSEWSKERDGQVIVCEQQNANWLPFIPLGTFKANNRSAISHEAIYTN